MLGRGRWDRFSFSMFMAADIAMRVWKVSSSDSFSLSSESSKSIVV